MNMMDTGGAMMIEEDGMPSSNTHIDEEDSGDSTMNLKDRAAKETKRTLARKETRAGTLLQA
jgi:hypothetical protein